VIELEAKEEKKEVKVDYLAKIVEFYKDDLAVKDLVMSVTPKEEFEFRPEQYAKILKTTIEYIKYHICKMLNLLLPYELKNAENFFKDLEQKLYSCGNDYYYLRNFYEVFLRGMREEIKDEVGKKCKGGGANFGVSLRKAASVNELLHIIHQTVTNNETLYCKMPKLREKQNDKGNPITLYGEETELSDIIFNAFPEEIECDFARILSFMGQFLIMVPGRGHALSIEITPKGQDEYYVVYFIPKICNIDMVNELKGVQKVDKNSIFTRGVFTTTTDELPFELVDFISKVPTDHDMFKEGGKAYRP